MSSSTTSTVSTESRLSNLREEALFSQRPHDEENPPSATTLIQEGDEEKQDGDSFLVAWDEDEMANPRNWSNAYKSWITFQLGMLALSASLGSSIISPAEEAIATYTGVSAEATVLVISLYILG